MTYDGLRKGVIDANSHVTVYVSDALGRVASIEEGLARARAGASMLPPTTPTTPSTC
jgi:hypothetical protein